MKLKVMAMANAAGLLGAIYFIGCWVIAGILPDLYKAIFVSWMHMIEVSSLWKTGSSSFLLGFVSFTVVSWVTGWLFAWFYNKFAK